jgi:hypothetical protein
VVLRHLKLVDDWPTTIIKAVSIAGRKKDVMIAPRQPAEEAGRDDYDDQVHRQETGEGTRPRERGRNRGPSHQSMNP